MKKSTLFLGVIFGIVFTQKGNSQNKTWSLQACINYAVTNNLQIKEQKLNLEEAKINTNNAKGDFLPDLNGRIRNTWSSGLSENPITGAIINQKNRVAIFSLNSNITIFDGLKNYNTLQQNKLREIAAQFNIDRIKDNITLNIANSYLQVLLQKENITILKGQYQLTQEQIKRTQELIKAGSLPKGDILQLQATAATDLQNIVQAENSYAIAKLGLKRLLNLDLNQNFEVKKEEIRITEIEVLNKPVDSILQIAMKTRNEIKFSKQNVTIATKGVKIAKSEYLPTLSGFLNFNTNEQRNSLNDFRSQLENNRGVSLGLEMRIPIFNKRRIKNGVAQSKIGVLKSENQLAQVQQQLTQDIHQAYLDAQGSYKAYQANDKTVMAQKQAFEYETTKYNVGVSNAFEFTQTKVRYQNSQTEFIRAKYDLLFKLKLLELYTDNVTY